MLLVVDDHFIFLDDRPTGVLPVVTPGENGHPNDRGLLTVLAAAATDCAEVCNLYCDTIAWCTANMLVLYTASFLGTASRIEMDCAF